MPKIYERFAKIGGIIFLILGIVFLFLSWILWNHVDVLFKVLLPYFAFVFFLVGCVGLIIYLAYSIKRKE